MCSEAVVVVGNRILEFDANAPRPGSWCSGLVPDAHGAESAYENGTVDLIAIPNHVAGSPVPSKGLGDLACDPLRCRFVVTLIQTRSLRFGETKRSLQHYPHFSALPRGPT